MIEVEKLRMSDRPSPIAGTWYPGNATTLSGEIADYLARADSEPPPGTIFGIVVPHAGYHYSAQTAAFAFRLLRGLSPELVTILSPLHQPHPAPLLTTGYDAYTTPLGRVEVDAEAVRQLDSLLSKSGGRRLFPLVNDEEHSLEIELPFLQQLLGSFRLLPVMVRDQSTATVRALGAALAGTLQGRSSIIVASSDLSHFHPQAQAVRLDDELLRRLAAFDPQAVLDGEADGSAYACGRGAIAAALWAAKALGADRVSILHHSTSGEVTGDLHSVVGYGAAVIWRREV